MSNTTAIIFWGGSVPAGTDVEHMLWVHPNPVALVQNPLYVLKVSLNNYKVLNFEPVSEMNCGRIPDSNLLCPCDYFNILGNS